MLKDLKKIDIFYNKIFNKRKKMYKLIDNIDETNLCLDTLCANTSDCIIPILQKNKDKLYNFKHIIKLLTNKNSHIINSLFNENQIENILNSNKQYVSINKKSTFFDISDYYEQIFKYEYSIYTLIEHGNKTALLILQKHNIFNPLLVDKHLVDIIYKKISLNSNNIAINILSNNLDLINWKNLLSNSNIKAIDLLINNKNKIDLEMLTYKYFNELMKNTNPKIIELIKAYPSNKIKELYTQYNSMAHLCGNENSNILIFFELHKYTQYIAWNILSKNSCDEAINILEHNMDKINWYELSSNNNPRAIKLIEQHLYNLQKQKKIIESITTMNQVQTSYYLERHYPNILYMLNNNTSIIKLAFNNKIYLENIFVSKILSFHPSGYAKKNIMYVILSKNPNIFVYDYEMMYKNMWKENGIGQGLSDFFGNPNKI
jgi:hypothetical protein